MFNVQNPGSLWPAQWPLSPRTKDADDETLLALIRDGSPTESKNALETLFVRHHKDVWLFVRSRVSSAADADEISSAVWVVVLEKIEAFVWTGAPLKSWIFGIAYRKILEVVSNPDAPTTVSLETLAAGNEEALHYLAGQLHLVDGQRGPVSAGIKKQADVLLHRLIARLPEVERKIIMLIYFEEAGSASDVAHQLGMNKNTIRVYHKRARDKLRASPELRGLFESEVGRE